MKIEDKIEELNKKDKNSLNKILGSGYSMDELKQFMNALNKKGSNISKPYKIGQSHVKMALFGDNHIGHLQYDNQLMKLFARETKKHKVDFALNGGDIFDGWYQNRPSSIFEQNAIGFDNQMNMAVEELSQLEVPLYFITGNHSYNTFVRGAGVEAGPILESRLKERGLEAKYLGNGEGDLVLKSGTKIKALHPDGGTAYALSYRPQKIIESLTGGEKPHILTINHFHKLEQLYYRNVYAFQGGTFCGQTKFMRGKNIPAHKGFWILDIFSKRGGNVDKIVSQLYTV